MSQQEKSIDQLIAQIAENPDLREDVLPFLMPTLVKLKQISQFLSGKPNDNIEAFYEFNSICTNYLPSTLQSFCSLPIEFRNTKILKNNKTARELLIDDLQKIITKTESVEDSLLSKEEKAFLTNHTYLSNRLTAQSEAPAFENRFDYKAWSETPDAANTYIVSPATGTKTTDQEALKANEAKAMAQKQLKDAEFAARIKEAQKEKRLKNEKFKQGVSNIIGSFGRGVRNAVLLLIPVSVISGIGYGISIPARHSNNRQDIGNELRYVASTIGERGNMNKAELEALRSRVEVMHEKEVGDFYPLKAKILNDKTLSLTYTLGGSCGDISRNLFYLFFNSNINGSFKIDGLEYVNQWVVDNTQFESLGAYANSRLYSNRYNETLYTTIKETLKEDKNIITGSVKRTARNLKENPVAVPIATSGITEEGFTNVCKPDTVDIEVQFTPSDTLPVYQPKIKPKM